MKMNNTYTNKYLLCDICFVSDNPTKGVLPGIAIYHHSGDFESRLATRKMALATGD